MPNVPSVWNQTRILSCRSLLSLGLESVRDTASALIMLRETQERSQISRLNISQQVIPWKLMASVILSSACIKVNVGFSDPPLSLRDSLRTIRPIVTSQTKVVLLESQAQFWNFEDLSANQFLPSIH